MFCRRAVFCCPIPPCNPSRSNDPSIHVQQNPSYTIKSRTSSIKPLDFISLTLTVSSHQAKWWRHQTVRNLNQVSDCKAQQRASFNNYGVFLYMKTQKWDKDRRVASCNYTLKNKGFRRGFCSEAIEEPFYFLVGRQSILLKIKVLYLHWWFIHETFPFHKRYV